jgi:hypothetical protein
VPPDFEAYNIRLLTLFGFFHTSPGAINEPIEKLSISASIISSTLGKIYGINLQIDY